MSLKIIKAIASNLVHAYESLEAELKQIDDQVKNNRITGQVALEMKVEINHKISELMAKINEDFSKQMESYEKRANAWGTLKGAHITEDSKLFDSGLMMTEEQYTEMINKYKNNATMLSLISSHADKNEIELYTDYALTAAEKIANYNEILTIYKETVNLYVRGDKLRYAVIAAQEEYHKDIEITYV